ncbi:pseudouridine synthase [Alginatibacterium sediminis]|uniref:Pseudouridine synthase n=1 Tax=Alginatibacterium sediminis TaxID=2164068 RepID=A0A420EIA4_9ALTE|nr:pseudouridine synthase [Alginatibacterium sediminis]RKF20462.1 pseudouridine synthase [Alginatibacterium sediminis]
MGKRRPEPAKTQLILLNKPFDVLSQFTDDNQRATLKNYVDIPNVYAAGRLDRDSEGLLILTNSGKMQHLLAHPDNKTDKCYWVQVEGQITNLAIDKLSSGIELKDGITAPAQCELMQSPEIWPRVPPIRERAAIPTSWISLTISEGRNRQVRRMTAAVGFPTLRLIRYRIGQWTIDDIDSGNYTIVEP